MFPPPRAGAPRLASASCAYLGSVYEKRGGIPTWKQKFKDVWGERKAPRLEHREAKIALAAETEAESSDAYKHEIKGAVLQRLRNPLRPEGEGKL